MMQGVREVDEEDCQMVSSFVQKHPKTIEFKKAKVIDNINYIKIFIVISLAFVNLILIICCLQKKNGIFTTESIAKESQRSDSGPFFN
mmetsp:Transcript_159/g.154  ORF Transcript_159/g.154 Transcript_159/m.154 type:complete len:88 (-) Transcript_159:393-656(-)